MTTATQLLSAPESSVDLKVTQLAYLDAYDAILNDDYAWVAYRETEASGTWRVRIKARHLTGVVFEPAMMQSNARSASAQGKHFFTWGNGMEASSGDARRVEYRVHVEGGKPVAIEVLAQMRKADGAADAARSVRFAWPA